MSKINAAEKITNEKFLNLYKLYAENKHNKPLEYLIASRAKEVDDLKAINHNEKSDEVIILGATEDNKFILIRQYRYTIGDYIYELPAGLIDSGENIYEASMREFKEETGLSLHTYDMKLSRPFYSSAGLTDECCSIVFGMASGSDILFGMTSVFLKAGNVIPLKIHCILPCKNYNSSHKYYKDIKLLADEWIELSDKFYKGCDNVRDQYMVDHCDVLLAIWDGNKSGGVWSTIRKAQKAGKQIVYCPKEILENKHE